MAHHLAFIPGAAYGIPVVFAVNPALTDAAGPFAASSMGNGIQGYMCIPSRNTDIGQGSPGTGDDQGLVTGGHTALPVQPSFPGLLHIIMAAVR